MTSGERIGHYHLLQTLGEGGMGVVYLATDPDGRKVAIKVLRPAVAGDATALRRLAREVDSMRRVHSPHVAEILDADVTAQRPYIVTQYVPGRTLEEVVEESGPIWGNALQRLAVGLAGALSAIHGAGIIHRDMKPGNVMLLDGEPVVIDFGIAQGADATRLTATGMVIGTPGYLAPEIIEGEDAGAPSDVHAWAGTVTYAATGRPPFGSGSFESIFYKIMQGTPDLDGVPDGLLPLIRAAMARHPAERPTAVKLVQLARRLHLEATITDLTRVDQPIQRVDTTAAQSGPPSMQIFAAPPPPPTRAEPTTRPQQQVQEPVRPEPVPAQPKDFKGLLPPAAPPPPPAPPPAQYERQYEQFEQTRVDGARSTQAPSYNAGQSAGYDNYAPYGQARTQPPQQAPPPRWDRPEPQPYDPYAQPGGRQPAPREPEGPKPPKPFGWYRVLSLISLAALIGFAAAAPFIALAVAAGGVLLLRIGDRSAKSMESKRTRKGPSSGDVVAAVLKSPLALPRATLSTLLLAPLGLLGGFALLIGLLVAKPGIGVARAESYGVMVVIVLLYLGPGSAAPRRQMARLWGFFLPRREPAIGLSLILGLFAGVLLALGLSPSHTPDTKPLTGVNKTITNLSEDIRDLVGR